MSRTTERATTQPLPPANTRTTSLTSVARHRPYPDYKDSDFQWLKEIPAHWKVERLKYVATVNDETLSESTDPNFTMEYIDIGSIDAVAGIIGTETLSFEGSPSRARRVVRHGDVIVSTVRTYLKAIAPIEDPPTNTIVSTGFAVVRPEGIGSRFASYVLRSPYFVELVVANSVGVGYPAINAADLGCLPIALPTMAEQRIIAIFLDRETAKIDALVAKKERLIELLKEKRSALIARAVTKGIDPTVPMKDSGVRWLAEIPKNWEAKKVNRLCLVQRGASPRPIDDPIYFDDNGEYAWVRIIDVTNSERYLTHTSQRLSALGKSKSVPLEPGDLFLSVAASVGKPIITKVKCCIHDGFVYFVGLNQNREYLFYVFSCSAPYEGLGKLGTQLNLNTEIIGDIRIPVPPLDEQEAIRQHLDRETASIDDLMTKVGLAMDRLRELRTGLVSGAVTGKIDVRDAV